MTIVYNKVTWYSKLLALIIFIAMPFIGFYLGVKYQEMKTAGYEGRRILIENQFSQPSSTNQAVVE